jgi:hypothetical protein
VVETNRSLDFRIAQFNRLLPGSTICSPPVGSVIAPKMKRNWPQSIRAWSWGVLVVRFGSGTQATISSTCVSKTLLVISFSAAILNLLEKGLVSKYGLVREVYIVGVVTALERHAGGRGKTRDHYAPEFIMSPGLSRSANTRRS